MDTSEYVGMWIFGCMSFLTCILFVATILTRMSKLAISIYVALVAFVLNGFMVLAYLYPDTAVSKYDFKCTMFIAVLKRDIVVDIPQQDSVIMAISLIMTIVAIFVRICCDVVEFITGLFARIRPRN